MGARSLKGSLLIASPGLVDPNFLRTVVLVAEHNAEGALGLVLNRPSELNLGQLWRSLQDDEAGGDVISAVASRAFVGGPVQRNAVLVLHGHPDLADAADPIIPGVYLGSDVELLSRLMERGAGAPETEAGFRVFCGYAGWGAGQLDSEMQDGGWLKVPASTELVFQRAPEDLWSATMASLGGFYRFLAQMPLNPEFN